MDPILRRFLDFFQDYINICQLPSWPSCATTREEILNAFKIAEHIQKCLERLEEKSLTDSFLAAVKTQNDQCASSYFLNQCFSHPPRYILKKIIQSSCAVSQMDEAFKLFVDLFSEDELEITISECILQAASKETLLKNLSIDLSEDVLLDFKSKFVLTELTYGKMDDSIIDDMLTNVCTQEIVNLLVLSILNKDSKYSSAVNSIVDGFVRVMSSTSITCKQFWKFLFNTDDRLIQLCLYNGNILNLVLKALVDIWQLIDKKMSMDYFYIEMTYAELIGNVQKLCKNPILKSAFYDYVCKDSDLNINIDDLLPCDR